MSRFLLLGPALAVAIATAHAQESAPAQEESSRQAFRRLREIADTWSAEWELHAPPAASRDTSSARASALQLAQSEDPELRRRAVEALGKADPQARPSLGGLLWALGDSDPGVREAATKQIQTIPPQTLLQQILDVLVANDPDAVTALDTALPDLSGALGDDFLKMFRDTGMPIPLRRAAAYSLGRMRVRAAAAELAKGAWEREGSLATSCALALAAMRDTRTVRDWVALRKHPDGNVRWLAVEALAELGGREAFAALAEAAYGAADIDAELAPHAIKALAYWPLGDCVPALIKCMKRNTGFRHQAAELLRLRTGQAIGDDASAWEDWYVNGPAPPPEPPAPPERFGKSDLLGHAVFVPPDLQGAF